MHDLKEAMLEGEHIFSSSSDLPLRGALSVTSLLLPE